MSYNIGNVEKISLRRLFIILLPVALSLAAKHFLAATDRIVLSYYNVDAVNVATFANIAVHCISGPAAAFASSAIILVGKSNGSGQLNKVSVPIWQMIFFSCSIFLLYLVLLLVINTFHFPEFFLVHKKYLDVTILFGFLDPLISALSAFFIGIGETRVIVICYLISNVLNTVLNVVLVFGFYCFPALGAVGAAIATVISEALQCIILFCGFFFNKNSNLYQTKKPFFCKKTFLQCVKIGFFSALLIGFEMLGFCFGTYIHTIKSFEHATVNNISLNVFILMAFYVTAIEQIVTALSSNLIGANKHHFLPEVIKKSLLLNMIVGMVILVPFFWGPRFLIDFFWSSGHSSSVFGNSVIKEGVISALRYVWVYFVLRCIAVSARGVLLAFNNLMFSAFSTGINMLCFYFFPIIILFFFLKDSFHVYAVWKISCVYCFCSVLVFYYRCYKILDRYHLDNFKL